MPRSKLEKYINILEVLVPKPIELEKISYETNIECRMLYQYLNFLRANKLVEKRSSSETKTVYAITERGLAVFRTLQAQKYLRKLKSILPMIEEATEVELLLSRHSDNFKDSV